MELWLKINITSHPALTIPLETCTRFAGRVASGSQSVGAKVTSKWATNCRLSSGNTTWYLLLYKLRLLYYRCESYCSILGPFSPLLLEPRWVNVDMMNVRASNASARTAHRADFRQDRDGTCVMSGAPPASCKTCHVVPHSKGDQPEVSLNISCSFQAVQVYYHSC